MANRLLRYELVLFRRSFADGFSRTRDRILLAAILVLIALTLPGWLRRIASLQLPAQAALLGAGALAPSLAWQRLVAARLRWLGEESAVAADALHHPFRRTYLAAAHLPVLAIVVAGLMVLSAATGSLVAMALGLLAYGFGTLLPQLKPGRPARGSAEAPRQRESAGDSRHAASRAILRAQTLDSRSPAVAAVGAVAAVFALTALAGFLVPELGRGGAFAAALALSVLALLAVGRLDPPLLGFLPYAGYGPEFVALRVSALPVACFLAAAAGIGVGSYGDKGAIILLLLLLYAIAVIYCVARSWLYFGRSSRAVEIQVHIELAAAAILATIFPPLAVAALGWRLVLLRRRYVASMWKSL